MISEIHPMGIPCFGREPDVIPDLSALSFFYGPNGSGKSSISNRLSEASNENRQVQLFNEQFIKRLVSDEEGIPGVFVIRDGAPEVQNRIDELLGSSGDIAQRVKLLDGLEKSIKRNTDLLSEAKVRLTDSAWGKRSEMPAALQFVFDGLKSSRAKHVKKVLDTEIDNDIDIEELIRTAELLAGGNAFLTPLIAFPADDYVLTSSQIDLLGSPILSANSTSFSDFVDRLSNRDWVSHGRQYLVESDGCCPFCQQAVDESLSGALLGLFDRHYNQSVEAVKEIQITDDRYRQRFEHYSSSNAFEFAINREEIRSKLDGISASLEIRRRAIADKIDAPSASVAVNSLSEDIDELKEMIAKANREIERGNRLVEDRNGSLANLRSRAWVYYVSSVIGGDLRAYQGECVSPNKALEGLRGRHEDTVEEVAKLRAELATLQSQLTSSQPTVDDINSTLRALGFHNFEIRRIDGEDTYKLVRPDGSIAGVSLSEGERTLISFLYFYHQISRAAEDISDSRSLVAVIDDPVSSLDSETLFVINMLVRRILNMCSSGESRLSQIILLTHSAFFYKEVTFEPKGMSSGNRSYFVIRKGETGESFVQSFDRNPIQSTYTLLWDEVRRAESNAGELSISLPNSMRRIIENYFGIMGGIKNEHVYDRVDSSVRLACESLMSWINDGSHTAPWDVDYVSMSFDSNVYLRAFRAIFEATGQSAHYEMMMNVENRV